MTPSRAATAAAFVAAAAALVWLLFVGLPRWSRLPVGGDDEASASAGPATPGKKIKARLFYVSEDGTKLTSMEHDVPYGASTVEQARAIIEAQLGPTPTTQVSAVPAGTTLRALFVTPDGQAYVDFSRELASAHPGGSLTELLTVYTLVDALTVNLPAITAVQLLVDGKEVDTLAGHVDVRLPLMKNLDWVQ